MKVLLLVLGNLDAEGSPLAPRSGADETWSEFSEIRTRKSPLGRGGKHLCKIAWSNAISLAPVNRKKNSRSPDSQTEKVVPAIRVLRSPTVAGTVPPKAF